MTFGGHHHFSAVAAPGRDESAVTCEIAAVKILPFCRRLVPGLSAPDART
jgi:hypothetical protein